jgi:DNA-binding winged helix-turn-helix (wHTH) protein
MLAYRFGEWLIEPHLNRASRDGTHRSLPPKAMDLLVCLLERPGDVVSTTELLQRG